MNISSGDVMLPIVPMFHVNAWGNPYACPVAGAKMVMPGNKMGDGPTLAALINEEGVTMSAGVPTVWLNLLAHLRASGERVETLTRVVVATKEMRQWATIPQGCAGWRTIPQGCSGRPFAPRASAYCFCVY